MDELEYIKAPTYLVLKNWDQWRLNHSKLLIFAQIGTNEDHSIQDH